MKVLYTKPGKLKPAIFLDRDGVINRDIKGKYIIKPSQLKIYKTAIDGLKRIKKNHFYVIIITNQSAIGRGYITEKEFFKINNKMLRILKQSGIKIDAVYYCPHKPEDNCNCRKPKPGLIQDAVKDYPVNMRKSFFVGDKKTDMELAKKMKLKAIFVLTGQGRSQLKKYGKKIKYDFLIKNLKELTKIIND